MSYPTATTFIVDGTLFVLLAFSVITWTLILFKIWQFARNTYDNRRFDQAFWECESLAAAQTMDESLYKGPQARIAMQGFKWLNESQQETSKRLKYQGIPVELLEHSLLEQMQHEQRKMDGGLTMLASIGSTSPFVGLFGTVLGIMQAMHQITASGSTSLDVVAGPIGDALVATAIGIAVAVPAVLAYNLFLRRVKHQRTNLENFAISFVHIVFGVDNNSRQDHGV